MDKIGPKWVELDQIDQNTTCCGSKGVYYALAFRYYRLQGMLRLHLDSFFFCQLILLFNLFLLLFISPIALFSTIHGSYCTNSANFYFYLQYFQQKFLVSVK